MPHDSPFFASPAPPLDGAPGGEVAAGADDVSLAGGAAGRAAPVSAGAGAGGGALAQATRMSAVITDAYERISIRIAYHELAGSVRVRTGLGRGTA